MDTEKTYSGLTDGCAAAGRAGCKLIEITGDNASGDDVKALVNYAHDVIDFLSSLIGPTDPFDLRLPSSSIATGLNFPFSPGSSNVRFQTFIPPELGR